MDEGVGGLFETLNGTDNHAVFPASTPVDPCCLRLGDAFQLALATEVGFELGEHTEHVEKALTCRRAGIDADRLRAVFFSPALR
jgi:hypothetical protein